MLSLTQSQLSTNKNVNEYTPITVEFPSIGFLTTVQNVSPLDEAIKRLGLYPEKYGLIFCEPSLTEDKYLLLADLVAEAKYSIPVSAGWRGM